MLKLKYRDVYADLSCGPVQYAFISPKCSWAEFSQHCAEFNSVPGRKVIGAIKG